MESDSPERLVELAKEYLLAIERGDVAWVAGLLHVDMVQQEFPNRLNPTGQLRDRTGLLASFELGRSVLAVQHFEIQNTLAQGDHVALEVIWTGTLATTVADMLPAGAMLQARFAVFLTFRDSKIIAQRNYDCFDPW